VTEHAGQHPNCRACGTNPRTLGTNPRGASPPDPPAAEASMSPTPLAEWTGPEHDPAAGPFVDDPAEKLAAAHQALAAARKPDMSPPPPSTRGAIHR